MSLDEVDFEYFETRIKRRKRREIFLTIISVIGFILFIYCCFRSNEWLVNYRLSKFTNLGITICTTKTMSCGGKSGCKIRYTYSVNNVLYGGGATEGKRYSYRGAKYYIVYSKDDPTLQIILPEYDVSKPLNPDILKKEYLFERMECYIRTDKKDDWGLWSWNDLFEYEKAEN